MPSDKQNEMSQEEMYLEKKTKLTYELAMLPMVFFVDRISMVAFGRVQCPTFGQLDQLALNVLPLPSHSDVIIILWITFSSQRKHTIWFIDTKTETTMTTTTTHKHNNNNYNTKNKCNQIE